MTFYDASGDVLAQYTAVATNTTDRWELVGASQSIPVHARTAVFEFIANGNGGTDDSYLDGAFFYVQSNNLRPDQGAEGNTDAAQSMNTAPHLGLRTPDLYVDWVQNEPLQILWNSFGNVSATPVRIDLYQDGPNGPQFLTTIVSSTPDTGEYTWTAADSGINFGTYGLRIQISLVGDPAVFDRSTETFTVPENTTTFYVNDGSTTGDQYTTAPGSNRNDGRLPSAPKPYINNILRIYSLGPGDTLYVDTGNYAEIAPIVLSSIVGVGDDRGFTLTRPDGPRRSRRPVLRQHPDRRPADRAGQRRLHDHRAPDPARAGSTASMRSMTARALTAENLTILNSSSDGIRVDTGSSVQDLGSNTMTSNAGYGINVNGPVVTMQDNVVTGNGNTGIDLVNPGNATVEGNEVTGNLGTGIYVSNSVSGTTAVVGADVGQGNGNDVSGNSGDGIDAYGNVLVVGNAVSGATGANDYGIYLYGASALENVVYGNTTGIRRSRARRLRRSEPRLRQLGRGHHPGLRRVAAGERDLFELARHRDHHLLRWPDRQQPDLRQPQPGRADRIARHQRNPVHEQYRLPADRRRGGHRGRHQQRRPPRQHPLDVRRLRHLGLQRQPAGIRQRLQRPDDQRRRPGRFLAGRRPAGPPLLAERRFHRPEQLVAGSAVREPQPAATSTSRASTAASTAAAWHRSWTTRPPCSCSRRRS